jgi:hypothetical protein
MPAVAEGVPNYIDCVSICVDDNDAGRKNSTQLAELLQARDIEVRLIPPFDIGSAAR